MEKNNYVSSYVCNECRYAIREEIANEAALLGIDVTGCVVYISSEKSYYTDAEMAMLQIIKCQKCKKYYDDIEKIRQLAEGIPQCFKSMNEIPNGSLTKISFEAEEIKKYAKYTLCKQKTLLRRIIREYIESNNSKKVDFVEMSEFVKDNNAGLEYFAHPLSLKFFYENFYKV